MSGTVHALHDDALANTSYLVEVRGGVTIDPPRDIDAHIALADQLGVEVVCHIWAEVK